MSIRFFGKLSFYQNIRNFPALATVYQARIRSGGAFTAIEVGHVNFDPTRSEDRWGAAIVKHRDAFEAISDPSRRFLLEEIRRRPRTVNELAQGLTISRPAVSQHLKALRDCGLVTVSAVGTRRVYSLHSSGFTKLNLWLDQFWSKPLHPGSSKGAPASAARMNSPDCERF